MFKKTEYGVEMNAQKQYNGYFASTFAELETENEGKKIPTGSTALYVKYADSAATGIGVAIKDENMWVSENGDTLMDYAPITKSIENGTITVTLSDTEVSKARIGETVTIAASADDGYSLTSLTVNGEDFDSGDTLTLTAEGAEIVAVTEAISHVIEATFNFTEGDIEYVAATEEKFIDKLDPEKTYSLDIGVELAEGRTWGDTVISDVSETFEALGFEKVYAIGKSVTSGGETSSDVEMYFFDRAVTGEAATALGVPEGTKTCIKLLTKTSFVSAAGEHTVIIDEVGE